MEIDSDSYVDDLVELSALSAEAMLNNLRLRFDDDLYYTSIGSILLAINPYKRIQQTLPLKMGPNYPHPFQLACKILTEIQHRKKSQSVIISGESGSGKTETAKILLNYFTLKNRDDMTVSKKILACNPVFEIFGNAQTVYNNNSSRFGKFTKLIYGPNGTSLLGAKISQFLLEKTRVIKQEKGERNYHVFYALLNGVHGSDRELYRLLTSASEYSYLANGDNDSAIDDEANYNLLLKSFEDIGMSTEIVKRIFKRISGILLLGNIEFALSGDKLRIRNEPILQDVCDLLELGGVKDIFHSCLVKKLISAGNRATVYEVPLTLAEATENRDAFAKALYSTLFESLIAQINGKLKKSDLDELKDDSSSLSIGIVDIFGFENFGHNSFEQFCINYANEKLHKDFNDQLFIIEQEDYIANGVPWNNITYVDNSECVNMIEGTSNSMINILNDECKRPKGNDIELLRAYDNVFGNNKVPFFGKEKLSKDCFKINHFSEPVSYNIVGFLDKNWDSLNATLSDLADTSISAVFDDLLGVGKSSTTNASTTKKKETVSQKFRANLNSIVHTLSLTERNFVRCISPNKHKQQDLFEEEKVLHQLRRAGILEVLKLRKAGYPRRIEFKQFAAAYGILFSDEYCLLVANPQPHEIPRITKLMKVLFDFSEQHCFVGKSKIFLHDKAIETLDGALKDVYGRYATYIQSFIRRSAAMGEMNRLADRRKLVVQATTVFQKQFRALAASYYYFSLRAKKDLQTCILLQSHFRSAEARRKLQALRDVKDKLSAVILLQAAIRRRKAELAYVRICRECNTKLNAVLCMQSCIRGNAARDRRDKLDKEVKLKRKVAERRKQIEMAGVLQCFVRQSNAALLMQELHRAKLTEKSQRLKEKQEQLQRIKDQQQLLLATQEKLRTAKLSRDSNPNAAANPPNGDSNERELAGSGASSNLPNLPAVVVPQSIEDLEMPAQSPTLLSPKTEKPAIPCEPAIDVSLPATTHANAINDPVEPTILAVTTEKTAEELEQENRMRKVEELKQMLIEKLRQKELLEQERDTLDAAMATEEPKPTRGSSHRGHQNNSHSLSNIINASSALRLSSSNKQQPQSHTLAHIAVPVLPAVPQQTSLSPPQAALSSSSSSDSSLATSTHSSNPRASSRLRTRSKSNIETEGERQEFMSANVKSNAPIDIDAIYDAIIDSDESSSEDTFDSNEKRQQGTGKNSDSQLSNSQSAAKKVFPRGPKEDFDKRLSALRSSGTGSLRERANSNVDDELSAMFGIDKSDLQLDKIEDASLHRQPLPKHLQSSQDLDRLAPVLSGFEFELEDKSSDEDEDSNTDVVEESIENFFANSTYNRNQYEANKMQSTVKSPSLMKLPAPSRPISTALDSATVTQCISLKDANSQALASLAKDQQMTSQQPMHASTPPTTLHSSTSGFNPRPLASSQSSVTNARVTRGSFTITQPKDSNTQQATPPPTTSASTGPKATLTASTAGLRVGLSMLPKLPESPALPTSATATTSNSTAPVSNNNNPSASNPPPSFPSSPFPPVRESPFGNRSSAPRPSNRPGSNSKVLSDGDDPTTGNAENTGFPAMPEKKKFVPTPQTRSNPEHGRRVTRSTSTPNSSHAVRARLLVSSDGTNITAIPHPGNTPSTTESNPPSSVASESLEKPEPASEAKNEPPSTTTVPSLNIPSIANLGSNNNNSSATSPKSSSEKVASVSSSPSSPRDKERSESRSKPNSPRKHTVDSSSNKSPSSPRSREKERGEKSHDRSLSPRAREHAASHSQMHVQAKPVSPRGKSNSESSHRHDGQSLSPRSPRERREKERDREQDRKEAEMLDEKSAQQQVQSQPSPVSPQPFVRPKIDISAEMRNLSNPKKSLTQSSSNTQALVSSNTASSTATSGGVSYTTLTASSTALSTQSSTTGATTTAVGGGGSGSKSDGNASATSPRGVGGTLSSPRDRSVSKDQNQNANLNAASPRNKNDDGQGKEKPPALPLLNLKSRARGDSAAMRHIVPDNAHDKASYSILKFSFMRGRSTSYAVALNRLEEGAEVDKRFFIQPIHAFKSHPKHGTGAIDISALVDQVPVEDFGFDMSMFTTPRPASHKMVIGAIDETIPSNMFVILFAGGERKIVANKPRLTLAVFLQHALTQRNISIENCVFKNLAGDHVSRNTLVGDIPQRTIMVVNDATKLEGQSQIKGLWNIPPQELAEQITFLDKEMFMSINPWEFHRPGNPLFSPYLTRMTDQFNRLSYGVITEILTGPDLVSRQKLLIYAIETMESLGSLNNMQSLMAFNAAISGSALSRLKKLFEVITPELREILNTCSLLASPLQNYSHMRDHLITLRVLTQPCIPFLGIFQRDILYIKEGQHSKEYANTLIAEAVELMRSYVNYPQLRADLYTQQLIKTLWAWDDDDLFEISKCHEPSVKKVKGAEKQVLPPVKKSSSYQNVHDQDAIEEEGRKKKARSEKRVVKTEGGKKFVLTSRKDLNTDTDSSKKEEDKNATNNKLRKGGLTRSLTDNHQHVGARDSSKEHATSPRDKDGTTPSNTAKTRERGNSFSNKLASPFITKNKPVAQPSSVIASTTTATDASTAGGGDSVGSSQQHDSSLTQSLTSAQTGTLDNVQPHRPPSSTNATNPRSTSPDHSRPASPSPSHTIGASSNPAGSNSSSSVSFVPTYPAISGLHGAKTPTGSLSFRPGSRPGSKMSSHSFLSIAQLGTNPKDSAATGASPISSALLVPPSPANASVSATDDSATANSSSQSQSTTPQHSSRGEAAPNPETATMPALSIAPLAIERVGNYQITPQQGTAPISPRLPALPTLPPLQLNSNNKQQDSTPESSTSSAYKREAKTSPTLSPRSYVSPRSRTVGCELDAVDRAIFLLKKDELERDSRYRPNRSRGVSPNPTEGESETATATTTHEGAKRAKEERGARSRGVSPAPIERDRKTEAERGTAPSNNSGNASNNNPPKSPRSPRTGKSQSVSGASSPHQHHVKSNEKERKKSAANSAASSGGVSSNPVPPLALPLSASPPLANSPVSSPAGSPGRGGDRKRAKSTDRDKQHSHVAKEAVSVTVEEGQVSPRSTRSKSTPQKSPRKKSKSAPSSPRGHRINKDKTDKTDAKTNAGGLPALAPIASNATPIPLTQAIQTPHSPRGLLARVPTDNATKDASATSAQQPLSPRSYANIHTPVEAQQSLMTPLVRGRKASSPRSPYEPQVFKLNSAVATLPNAISSVNLLNSNTSGNTSGNSGNQPPSPHGPQHVTSNSYNSGGNGNTNAATTTTTAGSTGGGTNVDTFGGETMSQTNSYGRPRRNQMTESDVPSFQGDGHRRNVLVTAPEAEGLYISKFVNIQATTENKRAYYKNNARAIATLMTKELLLNDNAFCTLTFNTTSLDDADEYNFYFHQSVLQCRAPYIYRNLKQIKERKVSKCVVEVLYEYIYLDLVQLYGININEIFELWRLVIDYRMEYLSWMIWTYCKVHLSRKNALLFAVAAVTWKIDILLKQSIQLVQENLREDQLKDKKLENLIFESLNLDKDLLGMMQGDVEEYVSKTVPPTVNSSAMLEDFQLLENGKCYDFKLLVTDITGKVETHKVTRAVLANNSVFFKNLFMSQSEEIQLTVDLPHSTFSEIIHILMCHCILDCLDINIIDCIFIFFRGKHFSILNWDDLESYLLKRLSHISLDDFGYLNNYISTSTDQNVLQILAIVFDDTKFKDETMKEKIRQRSRELSARK